MPVLFIAGYSIQNARFERWATAALVISYCTSWQKHSCCAEVDGLMRMQGPLAYVFIYAAGKPQSLRLLVCCSRGSDPRLTVLLERAPMKVPVAGCTLIAC
jgi:hypothetical protein